MLPRASVNVLPRASLLLILCVCLSVHVLTQASVHIPLQASVITVAVPRVYMLFCPKKTIKNDNTRVLAHLICGKNAHLLVIMCVRLSQKIGLLDFTNWTRFKKGNG